MTESLDHIEQMQRRLEQMAAREQVLIQALNEALICADQKLLDEVRSVTVDHETRRTVIQSELLSLAERIGVFPLSAKTPTTIDYQPGDVPDQKKRAVLRDADASSNGGDWRKATENIAEELDHYVSRAGSLRSIGSSA